MNARPQVARRATQPRTQGWSDPRFSHVADVVLTVAGLVFPPNRQPSAESAMRRVMTAFRLADPDALRAAVAVPGEPRDMLMAELTIGESYFFRESAALAVLEREIIARRRLQGNLAEPLRIWSAGCATGEEPYTLAMLLREQGWEGSANILGTDISRPRLDAARRARYTTWSLRGVSDERVARWFERRGKHFVVRDDVREAVQFAPLNLAADEYPSSVNGTSEQDLILCRNVLIYFELDTVALIAQRLLRALKPEGVLLLGASDPSLTELVSCIAEMTESGMVYRRSDGEPRRLRATVALPAWSHGPSDAPVTVPRAPVESERATPIPVSDDRSAAESDDARARFARGDYAGAAEAAERETRVDAAAVAPWLTWIRSLANAGDLARAGAVVAAALDLHRLEPELHYLHGMLLQAAGSYAEAARAARRALYLDRDLVIASALLGDALAQSGDRDGARRAFRNVVERLEARADQELLAAADGMTAGRLKRVAADRLRMLEDAA